jgi:hypothetical protein
MRRLLLLTAVLWLTPLAVTAQSLWPRPYQPNQIAVEAISPDLPDEATALSGAAFLSATYSLNGNVELGGTVPVARYATSNTSGSALGNPYVGVGLNGTRYPILLEIGVRIPASSDTQALAAGQAADIGRTAAFVHDAFSVSTLLNGRFEVGRRTSLRLRSGLGYATTSPGGTQQTNGQASSAGARERDWRFYYNAQLWQEGDRFITGFTLTGRATLTDPGPYGTRSRHHAALSIMPDWRRVQPGLIAGTALDPLLSSSDVQFFVGLTVSISYLR